MSQLRFGALGTSRITENALINYNTNATGAKVVAFASRTLAHAQTLAARCPGAWASSDYGLVVESVDVDVIYISLPNGMHFEWADRALRAGKHVLCEKALACNAAEARALVRLAAARHLILMEGLAYVHHPLIETLHVALASGVIGDVQRVDVRCQLSTPVPLEVALYLLYICMHSAQVVPGSSLATAGAISCGGQSIRPEWLAL